MPRAGAVFRASRGLYLSAPGTYPEGAYLMPPGSISRKALKPDFLSGLSAPYQYREAFPVAPNQSILSAATSSRALMHSG